MLVAGCWLLVTGYWMLDAGCWLLVAGCWLLDAGCWLLVGAERKSRFQRECWRHKAGPGLWSFSTDWMNRFNFLPKVCSR